LTSIECRALILPVFDSKTAIAVEGTAAAVVAGEGEGDLSLGLKAGETVKN